MKYHCCLTSLLIGEFESPLMYLGSIWDSPLCYQFTTQIHLAVTSLYSFWYLVVGGMLCEYELFIGFGHCKHSSFICLMQMTSKHAVHSLRWQDWVRAMPGTRLSIQKCHAIFSALKKSTDLGKGSHACNPRTRKAEDLEHKSAWAM